MSLPLAEQLLNRIKSLNGFLCSVESCTGGLIADRLTDISGSSDAFWGAFVVYDNTTKETSVGVDPQLILAHGAVSEEVARALAEGGLRRMTEALASGKSGKSGRGFKLLACVSTTGIAGPTGGSAEKPVGLCYVGIAVSGKPTVVEKLQASDGTKRLENKEFFARRAMELLLREI